MAPSVLNAIEAFSKLSVNVGWRKGQDVLDMCNINAESVISIADIETLINIGNINVPGLAGKPAYLGGATEPWPKLFRWAQEYSNLDNIKAQFYCYATPSLDHIRTIHINFYNMWLPYVIECAQDANSQSDGFRTTQDYKSDLDLRNSTGKLYNTLDDLRKAAQVLQKDLNKLFAAYKVYLESLHIDEVVRGIYALLHGYALLFHIHGVYTELRRIQLRNIYRLCYSPSTAILPDLQLLAQYTSDGIATSEWFLRRPLGGSRSSYQLKENRKAMISTVCYGAEKNTYSYEDTYESLPSTGSDFTLHPPSPAPLASLLLEGACNESYVREQCAARQRAVGERIDKLVKEPLEAFLSKCRRVRVFILTRGSDKRKSRLPPVGVMATVGEKSNQLLSEVASKKYFTVPLEPSEYVTVTQELIDMGREAYRLKG